MNAEQKDLLQRQLVDAVNEYIKIEEHESQVKAEFTAQKRDQWAVVQRLNADLHSPQKRMELE